MNRTPGIFEILQNDSTAASVLGSFIFMLVVTGIIYLTRSLIGSLPDNLNPIHFVWMTGSLFIAAVLVSLWRIRQVTEIFGNGIEVTAQVVASKVFRTRWTLRLRYVHSGEQHEITFNQLITEKTKSMIDQKEVVLIIDRSSPTRMILRDAYV